jgi:hypothetical protein
MILIKLRDKTGMTFYQNAETISTIAPLKYSGGALIILDDGREIEVIEEADSIAKQIFENQLVENA